MSNQFTEDPRVLAALDRIITQYKGKQFSDLIDAAGHQYVDLVMEGGGVLGIALTGYTYALEQAGIRFLGIGGTSAGSINALMIAALGAPAEAKSEKLVKILGRMPMSAFIDGDGDARDFSKALLEKAGMMKMLWKAMQVVDNLKEDLGLNPGKKFHEWLTGELTKAGVRTNKDLNKLLCMEPAGLQVRSGREEKLAPTDRCGRLAMIAADITTETKVDFPRMAKLYWPDPDAVNPADFARASMSIPLFFHPFQVRNCPKDAAAWQQLAGYTGVLPDSVKFIDGGIMSNFPINLFHEPYCVPLAPTFGVKIGIDRSRAAVIDKPAQLVGAIFDSARHTLDYDFLSQNPDYCHLVQAINTRDKNWLDFGMGEKDKVDLFAWGVEAAAEFLEKFDWDNYKQIRADLAAAFKRGR